MRSENYEKVKGLHEEIMKRILAGTSDNDETDEIREMAADLRGTLTVAENEELNAIAIAFNDGKRFRE